MKRPLSTYADALLATTTTPTGQSALPSWLVAPLAALTGRDANVSVRKNTGWADEKLVRKAIALYRAASARGNQPAVVNWQFSSDGSQAVQVLPQPANSDQQRAFNELSRRLESLTMNHPRLAPILEATIQQGYPFLAARIGDGFQSLTRRFGLPLEPKQAMQIAEQVVSALEYAHYRDVIHGSFDLPYVLVNEQGQASLLGVGVEQLRHRLGATGVGIISPLLPPEIETGTQMADKRTDVYAMGALLYVLLTGRVPSAGQEIQLSQSLPDVPQAVDAVVTKALAIDPDERYHSVVDMGRDLRIALRAPRAMTKPSVAAAHRAEAATSSRTARPTPALRSAPPAKPPATNPDGFPEALPMPEIDFTALEQALEMPQIDEWAPIEIPAAPEIPAVDWADLLQPVDLSQWAGETISLPYEAVETLAADPLVAAVMAVKATEQSQQSRQRPHRRSAEFSAPEVAASPADKSQEAAKPRRVRRS